MTLTLSVFDDIISPKFRAGVLGGTGLVGQTIVAMLENHPWISVVEIGASSSSAGKLYADLWTGNGPCPASVANITVVDVLSHKTLFIENCDLIFSALDADIATAIETDLATAGIPIFSNAASHRLDTDVPIVLAGVNPMHIEMVKKQPVIEHGGYIVTNANCTTSGLVTVLKPLMDAYGVEAVICTTMQAVSGAGNPGPAWRAIHANVIPDIPREEEKIKTEVTKLLGEYTGGELKLEHSIKVSAAVNRVPVVDGHTVSLSVKLARPPVDENNRLDVDEVVNVLRNYRGVEGVTKLPTMPERLIEVCKRWDHPQPKLHLHAGKGMTVSVGKVRKCEVLDVKFTLVMNNLILGAAGSTVTNAELAIATKLLC